ncbi:MAG: TonB-dependent receptor, partial [Bacteroidales bacterium]|nr:TonB-dependent receptor [Bacteroidales bacterium]
GYEVGDFIGNSELRPEITEEIEVGLDFRLWNNRIGVDVAYYNKSTTDLIWAAPVARSTGYGFQTQNLGKITNNGFEALLNVTLIRKSDFSWDISLNFTKNDNKLVSLNNKLEKAELNALRVDGGQQISWVAIPGQPVGVFEGRTARYTDEGKMVVDNKGLPRAAEDLKVYGNSQYDYFGGGSTTISYKNLIISALVDFRIGGLMYSRTKDISLWAGTVPATLYNNRQPFIIPNSVVETGKDENGEPVYVTNYTPIDDETLGEYWANGGSEIDGTSLVSKSFVKLREVSFSFSMPGEWYKKVGIDQINLSVVGNNLFLWTPHDQTYIDPEITTFGNDLQADFGEYGAQPSTRSVTFNLRVNF